MSTTGAVNDQWISKLWYNVDVLLQYVEIRPSCVNRLIQLGGMYRIRQEISLFNGKPMHDSTGIVKTCESPVILTGHLISVTNKIQATFNEFVAGLSNIKLAFNA